MRSSGSAGRSLVSRIRPLLAGTILLFSAWPLLPDADAARPPPSFWVARSSGWSRRPSRLVARGPHIKLFVTDHVRISQSQARRIVATFEHTVFPTDVRLFGLPRRLGPINVLLTPLPGTATGYFDENDLAKANSGIPYSNHANILYVRPPRDMPDPNAMADVNEVIAHELQHLIDFRIRVLDHHRQPEVDWLNEGLSFFAQVANGYWTPRDDLKVAAALAQPGWPVDALNEQDPTFLRHARLAYGRAGLLVTYLAARYGPELTRGLINSRFVGLEALNSVLAQLPDYSDAATAFADWGVATYLDAKGRYGYGAWRRLLLPDLRHPLAASSYYPDQWHLTLRPWGQQYLQFSSHRAGDLELKVSGPRGHIRAAAVIEDSTRVLPTEVHWLRMGHNGTGMLRVLGFGRLDDRATLIISDVSAGAGADHVHVMASLLHIHKYGQVPPTPVAHGRGAGEHPR